MPSDAQDNSPRGVYWHFPTENSEMALQPTVAYRKAYDPSNNLLRNEPVWSGLASLGFRRRKIDFGRRIATLRVKVVSHDATAGIALGAMVMLVVVVIVFRLFLAQQLLSQRQQENMVLKNQPETVKLLDLNQRAMNRQITGINRLQQFNQPEQSSNGGLDFDEAIFEMLEDGDHSE